LHDDRARGFAAIEFQADMLTGYAPGRIDRFFEESKRSLTELCPPSGLTCRGFVTVWLRDIVFHEDAPASGAAAKLN